MSGSIKTDDNDTQSEARLSRIETLWSVVRRAHASSSSAQPAQRMLLDQYGNAIQSYLIGAVGNVDLAEEIFQEFAVKLIKGDLGSADPQKGKFRSFVKTILFRMVALHFRKKSSAKVRAVEHLPDVEKESELSEEDDEKFLLAWRDGILTKAWDQLEEIESCNGPPYFSILRVRVHHPAATSNELAQLIGEATGKEIKPGNARVQVHRAREKFAHALFQSIADSLETPTREAVEDELIELRLIDFCRDQFESFQFQ